MNLVLPLTLAALLSAESEPADQLRAKDLARAAQKNFREGHVKEAIAQYEEALALRPRAALHFNLARCFEAQGDVSAALREFREYLRLAPDATDRAVVQESVTALEARLAAKGVRQVLVLAEPARAELTVDGQPRGIAPVYLELSPGAHVVTASAEGFESSEKKFVVEGPRSPQVSVVLRPVDAPVVREPAVVLVPNEPPPAAPPLVVSEANAPRRRVFTWLTLGVAVAASGAGIGLGAAANGTSNDLRANFHLQTQGDALVAQTRGLSTGANVAWGVAGAALIGAVILFFTEGAP